MTIRHQSISCVADEVTATAYSIHGITVIAYSRDDAEQAYSDWKAGRIETEQQQLETLPFEQLT